ncbi:SDR family NAD(P)-dependent oxidoreductase [Actinoplanes sp. G11-F43]|uniref:SDR family NAD(P)-dependent oxidoreductase n=1 Tax=Actinoplanes sp. G11-F43 TaxID=3424130 RepID=UPI003D33E117
MGVVVISGGTNGMGRELARTRAERGDRVLVLGRDRERGAALAGGRISFHPVDLSSLAENRRIVDEILAGFPVVDALALFANRIEPRRVLTEDGLERTFALYYLSRYLLSFGLRPALDRAESPVIVNVAGVGVRRGRVHWDDPTLAADYSTVTAQLQAGRANDLLGPGFAARSGSRARYVLYHPGFTRSGDRGPLPAVLRGLLGALAAVAAQPVAKAVGPVHDFLETPPAEPLTAIDRGRRLPLDLPTLNVDDAERLIDLSERIQRSKSK